MNHVTIAANSADNCGGVCTAASIINIKNSIVGDNTGGTTPDIGGTIVSGDYNQFENTTGASVTGSTNHDIIGDAQLGQLVQYVGSTVYMPGTTSPVLNTIPNGVNDCGTIILTDQRGALRPQGGACDKGAVERVASASISGRVFTTDGRPIKNAVVTLSGGNLSYPITAVTGSFGWYYFPNVPGEESYTLRASAKRFSIDPGNYLGVYLYRDTSNLDFTAQPAFSIRPSVK